MDKQIEVYDNTVSARTYLSYIAEQAGGFACIGRDGKLYIKTIGESTADLPLKYFQEFTWGEKFKISRVMYEDGVQLFEKGDKTENTLYINQDNMYIVSQEQIDSIYNRLNQLEIYSFEGNSIINPSLDVGDILNIDGKKIIYQGSIQYAGKFKASISSKIQCKEKAETTTRVPSQTTINRRVQSTINQIDGTITTLVERQEESQTKVNEITQSLEGTNAKITQIENDTNSTIEELEQRIEGVTNRLTQIGGDNLCFYSIEFWKETEKDEGINLEEFSSTEFINNSRSGYGYIVNNGNSKQEIKVQNGVYTISFKYRKIGNELTNGFIKINDKQYKLDSIEWQEFKETVEITMNKIDIEFVADSDRTLYITDLILNSGEEADVWTQNPNETRTDTITIGKGINVRSTISNTELKADSDGVRINNTRNNTIVAEFTDKGTETEELIVREQAQISGALVQKIGNQIWISNLL